MEKRAVIDENTPHQGGCCGGRCKSKPAEPQTKRAADAIEDHPTTRAADAVAEETLQTE